MDNDRYRGTSMSKGEWWTWVIGYPLLFLCLLVATVIGVIVEPS